jgi:hypothetical protein
MVEPMTEVRLTQDMLLRGWIRNELMSLWGSLEIAHRRTIGNDGVARRDRNWSMECDDLADRIRSASALVGPVNWREAIGMPSIIDGWYVWANEKIGIETAVLPTRVDVAECVRLQTRNGLRVG